MMTVSKITRRVKSNDNVTEGKGLTWLQIGHILRVISSKRKRTRPDTLEYNSQAVRCKVDGCFFYEWEDYGKYGFIPCFEHGPPRAGNP